MSRRAPRASERRPLEIDVDYLEQPAGSALISAGKTRCSAPRRSPRSVPRWLMGKGKGWMTAEYGLLPGIDWGAHGARGELGQAEGPHGRDPAPDRARCAP